MGSKHREYRGHHQAFSLVELIVVLAMIAFVAALVSLSNTRCYPDHRRQPQAATQLRGIHSSLVLYAQDHNGCYPGLDAAGEVQFADVETRLQSLLNNHYFTEDYLILPDDDKTPLAPGGTLTSANYSMALPMIVLPGGRRAEWRETSNSQAPAVTDRNAGSDCRNDARSIHADPDGRWFWWVAFNDNHVEYRKSPRFDTELAGKAFKDDNLFCAEGPNDAWMIYAGSGVD